MCHDLCEHALHCIASTFRIQYYVQTIPAEPIAHPFLVFPYLYVGTHKGKGAAQQFAYYFMMLDIICWTYLFTVAVWCYSCFWTSRYIYLLFTLGILCDDYPACGLASIYKLLIGEYFIIYTVGVVSRSQRLVPALNSVRGTANSLFKLNQSILIQKS